LIILSDYASIIVSNQYIEVWWRKFSRGRGYNFREQTGWWKVCSTRILELRFL